MNWILAVFTVLVSLGVKIQVNATGDYDGWNYEGGEEYDYKEYDLANNNQESVSYWYGNGGISYTVYETECMEIEISFDDVGASSSLANCNAFLGTLIYKR